MFEDLEIYRTITLTQAALYDHMQHAPEKLLKVYQHIQDKKFVQEREKLRMMLREQWKDMHE
jgi:hypothetical protein